MRRRLPTRAGIAVWRDQTRARAERRLERPLRRSFLRLYHDLRLHPDRFLEENAEDTPRAAWLGVPTWKLPSDMWVYQEILAETRPDVVVETGTQYGGSAMFYAGVMELLGAGEVITIDIDTSAVYDAVRRHPRITVIEGSSTSPAVIDAVRRQVGGRRAMVILDSDHQREHVAGELEAWPALVSPGCYLVVEDTALGTQYLPGWGGSLAAVDAWLPRHAEFERDRGREKFLVTLHPGGYLRRRGAAGSDAAPAA